MGSGKSTIGALLAQQLGCTFVELDGEIEAVAGISIPT
ncbi:shikimate kinase, partial [Flavobacterium sp.]